MSIQINNFFVRPHAGDGLWTLPLLPLAIIASSYRHPVVLTNTYRIVTVLSIGLLVTSLGIIVVCKKRQKLTTFNVWSIVIAIANGWCFNEFVGRGWPFSIASGIFSSLVFIQFFKFFLSIPESFTIGEAGIIAQGSVIFIFSTIENIARHVRENIMPRSNIQISTLIIQVGITCILFLSYIIYKFSISTTIQYYVTTSFIFLFGLILPLQVLSSQNPVLWIFNQIFFDIGLLKLIIFWSFCSGLATLAILYQINNAQKASTSIRKIFHLLAVVVYIPGLIYKCSFLYLASGVVLGVFFFLESMRIVGVPPLGTQLQDGYTVFADEKDAGNFALTPIYLLVGCSLPIWLHPAPCDVTDSAMFNILPLLSGILSIGIGDTFASIVGSNLGKLKWSGTKKTIEGTLACVVSQLGFVYLLHSIGCLPNATDEQILRLFIGVIVVALVEAKTDQVDNLILPIIMYIFLI